MEIRKVDRTGRNYLIVEFQIHFPSLVVPFKQWIHRFKANLRYKFTKWYYGHYGYNGKGHYVWKGGVWVPGNVKNTAIWHTYFDLGLGREVSGSSEIKANEKNGYIYTSHEEAERECNKRKAQLKKESKARVRKGVEKALEDVSRGRRSYAREIEQQARHDMRDQRERMQAAKTYGVR